MREYSKGKDNGTLSLIFVDDTMTLYHARTFFNKLKRVYPYFTDGHWRGNSASEWVVYGKVKAAVTLPLKEILQSPSIEHQLRRARLIGTRHGRTVRTRSQKREYMAPSLIAKVSELLFLAARTRERSARLLE